MDIVISSRVWADTSLPTSEKMVLLALDHLGDPDGFSWCGYKRISEVTGINLESKYLTKIINKLEEKGYILIWRQHGHKGGRGYTHIYWPIIGRTDEEILEIVMRRFVAIEDEARAIISQTGPIYDELIKRNRVSGSMLEETKPEWRDIKKGVPSTPNDDKGCTDYTQNNQMGVPETPKGEAKDKKGVPGTPRPNKESLNKESIPSIESNKPNKVLSPEQKMFLALAELCRIELKSASDKQKGQLGTASKVLVKLVTDVDQFKDKFKLYWTKMDWRGKKDQAPIPSQIQEVYGDYCYWLENGQLQRNGAHDGQKRTQQQPNSGTDPPEGVGADTWANIKATLDGT